MDSGEEEDSVTEIQLSDSSASYEPSDSELSDCEDNKSDDDESHSKNEKRKSTLNDWVIRKEEKQGKKKPSSSVSSLKAGTSRQCSTEERTSRQQSTKEENAKKSKSIDADGNTIEIPWLELRRHFIKSDKVSTSGSEMAQCLLCGPTKLVSYHSSTAANLKRHLKRKHECLVHEKRKQKLSAGDKKMRHCSLRTQHELDTKLADVFGSCHMSYSTVEKPAFRELIYGLQTRTPTFKLHPPARKKLTRIITEQALQYRSHLTKKLAQVKCVAATADAWKSFHRNYWGMTVHWLDKNLRRKKAILCCREIKTSLTHDVIATVVGDVLSEYNILDKTVCVTTDNGSNFIKAFEVYHGPDIEDVEEEPEIRTSSTEEEIEFINIDILIDEDDWIRRLPPHRRCAAHLLNLILSKDITHIDGNENEENDRYIKKRDSVMKKLRVFWKGQNSHSLIYKKYVKTQFKIPMKVRWHTYVDSIEQVLEAGLMKINQICDAVNNLARVKKTKSFLTRFSEDDFSFLNEYLKITKPIRRAIKVVESEKYAYLGVLLPALYGLRRALNELTTEIYLYCNPLVQSIYSAVLKRFQQFWRDPQLLIASYVHPTFKGWLSQHPELEEIAKKKFLDEIQKCEKSVPSSSSSVPSTLTENEKYEDTDIFYFLNSVPVQSERHSCEGDYFQEPPGTVDLLLKYPCLQNIFISTNTALPSSAAIERVFSIAGNILRKDRNRLTAENFEDRLLSQNLRDILHEDN